MTDGAAKGVAMPDERPSFFARMLSWISGGGKGVAVEEETLKVGSDFIMRVLPHRGRWLLIDAAEVTPSKVTGFFTVTKEVCDGHAIGDDAVLPGVLLIEMANQLLGVWYATQHPEIFSADKVLFARTGSYEEGEDIDIEEGERHKKGRYKASSFIRPGDLVRIEVSYDDLTGSMKTSRRGTFMELVGKNFIFKVGEDLKGSVGEVELKGVEPPKTTVKT